MNCKNLLLLLSMSTLVGTTAFSPLGPPPDVATTKLGWWNRSVETALTASMSLLLLAVGAPTVAFAAVQDISGMDFSGRDLAGQDFTGVLAKGTNFHGCNLQGTVFDNAHLERADFSGADVRGAKFVDATLEGASFQNAQAQRAVFSASILDVGDLENVDLTSSLWPSKLRIMICDMHELKGKNPVTGADSRDSIKCTEILYKS